jgi:hypothetical protein
VHVTFENGALAPALMTLAVTADQPRTPVAEMHYAVEGDEHYRVLEEGDTVASDVAAPDAVAAIADRIRRRVLDHLSVGGWTAAQAAIVRADGRRMLVLGDEDNAFTSRVRSAGDVVEGDDLVFFRNGIAVSLPQTSSAGLMEGPVAAAAVVRVGDTEEPWAALTSGQLVEALVAATLPVWKPSGDVLRACVALVGDVDGYSVAVRP